MAYVLIHLAVAIAAVVSAQRMLARGYILDDDDNQVPAGTLSFNVSLFVHYGLAAYCVGAVLWGAVCP